MAKYAWPVRRGTSITARFGQVSTVGNWKTCGTHTGLDFGCQEGDPVYATEAGNVWRRYYGAAFGITAGLSPDGPGEWQYSHLKRIAVPNGAWVEAGDIVGWAGTTGGVAPHLHLEWHPDTKNEWRCGIQADPLAELQRDAWMLPADTTIYLSYLKRDGHKANADGWSQSIKCLQEILNRHSLKAPGNVTLGVDGQFNEEDAVVVVADQNQHGFGNDPLASAFVGPKQMAHLVEATGAPYAVKDDRETDPDVKPWLCKAGARLRQQVNALWPERDKRTDGWIGDEAHCGPGAPPSEHCPDETSDPPGVVRALDIDADLSASDTTAAQRIADSLVLAGRNGDDRIYYVIHNGKIASGTYEETFWTWRDYDGSNPHTSHIHVSFKPAGDQADEDFPLLAPPKSDPEGWRRLFEDHTDATPDEIDMGVAVVAAESGGYRDAVGDLDLMDDKYGPSLGGGQVRVLKILGDDCATSESDDFPYADFDRYRDACRLKHPEYQVQATIAIARGLGWETAFSTVASGSHKEFLAEGFDLKVISGHERAACWGTEGCPGPVDPEPTYVTVEAFDILVERVAALEADLDGTVARFLTHHHGPPA